MLSGCSRTAAPPSPADSWEVIPLKTHARFNSVYFLDDQTGWLAGGSHATEGGLLGRTTDGGLHWDFESRVANSDTNSLTSVHFLNRATGIVGTDNGEVLMTTDAGLTWQTRLKASGGFGNAVSEFEFVSSTTAYAVIGDRVIQTRDAGYTWQCLTNPSGSCPAPPQCTGAEINPKLDATAIAFLTSTEAVAISRRYSVALSHDGGCTWEIRKSLTGADHLRLTDLDFIDAQHGWIVGEEGFAASTSDGGSQWSIQNTGVGADFTAVRFINRLEGYIIGRRINRSGSVILHTEDSGQTWSQERTVDNDLLLSLFTNDTGSIWAAGEVLDITHGQNLLRKSVKTEPTPHRQSETESMP